MLSLNIFYIFVTNSLQNIQNNKDFFNLSDIKTTDEIKFRSIKMADSINRLGFNVPQKINDNQKKEEKNNKPEEKQIEQKQPQQQKQISSDDVLNALSAMGTSNLAIVKPAQNSSTMETRIASFLKGFEDEIQNNITSIQKETGVSEKSAQNIAIQNVWKQMDNE